MSWTKMLICDFCGTQHSFFQTVGMERDLIGGLLGWQVVHVGRSVYDVCKDCKGDATDKQLQEFFTKYPVKNGYFKDIIDNAIVTGWNHRRTK